MTDASETEARDDDFISRILQRERNEVLQELEDWLETPMVVLAFVWLGLLVAELVWGEWYWFEFFGTLIWIIFIIDFAVKFALAPQKIVYLRESWLTVISLLIPALRVFRVARVFRVFRLARATRGVRLIRVVSSLNRGVKALRASLGRRGFGYVVVLTLVVTLGGAAGMYAFEKDERGGLTTYGEALWWTAMIMTTMGSQYWPQSVEGRALCLLLALYAFAVFGYVTASLATFFIGRDAANDEAELAGAEGITQLREEVRMLRDEIRARLPQPPAG